MKERVKLKRKNKCINKREEHNEEGGSRRTKQNISRERERENSKTFFESCKSKMVAKDTSRHKMLPHTRRRIVNNFINASSYINCISSSSSSSSSSTTTTTTKRTLSGTETTTKQSPNGFYEIRKYKVEPNDLSKYLELCAKSAKKRKELSPGFCGFFIPEVGSDLNVLTHVYHYKDYDERDLIREKMRKDKSWQKFLEKSIEMIEEQHSEVYIEANVATEAAGLMLNSFQKNATKMMDDDGGDKSSVFEIRTYTLQLGYNPIPKMQNLYAEGLPSKIKSDTNKLGELLWIGYCDVGDLNKFIEIWKYDSFQSHIKVRESARTAIEWRETIAKIAPMVTAFNTTLCTAASFSPTK